jgi:hypothetical protein
MGHRWRGRGCGTRTWGGNGGFADEVVVSGTDLSLCVAISDCFCESTECVFHLLADSLHAVGRCREAEFTLRIPVLPRLHPKSRHRGAGGKKNPLRHTPPRCWIDPHCDCASCHDACTQTDTKTCGVSSAAALTSQATMSTNRPPAWRWLAGGWAARLAGCGCVRRGGAQRGSAQGIRYDAAGVGGESGGAAVVAWC